MLNAMEMKKQLQTIILNHFKGFLQWKMLIFEFDSALI